MERCPRVTGVTWCSGPPAWTTSSEFGSRISPTTRPSERGKTKVVTATTCGQIIQDAQGAFRMEKTQGKLQALKPGRVEKVELWGATYGGKGRGG